MQSKYYKTSVELIILYDEVLVEGFLLFHMTLLLGFSLSNYELIAFSNFCFGFCFDWKHVSQKWCKLDINELNVV